MNEARRGDMAGCRAPLRIQRKLKKSGLPADFPVASAAGQGWKKGLSFHAANLVGAWKDFEPEMAIAQEGKMCLWPDVVWLRCLRLSMRLEIDRIRAS